MLLGHKRTDRAEVRDDLVLHNRPQQQVGLGLGELVVRAESPEHIRIRHAQAIIHTARELGLAANGDEVRVGHNSGTGYSIPDFAK